MLSKRYLFSSTSVVYLFFLFRGRGTHSLKLDFFSGSERALSKRCLFVKSCLLKDYCSGKLSALFCLQVFAVLSCTQGGIFGVGNCFSVG